MLKQVAEFKAESSSTVCIDHILFIHPSVQGQWLLPCFGCWE